MTASISFNIYEDFSKFKNSSDHYYVDYDKALKYLNETLKKLVKDNNLVFTYKGKKVKILLPLGEYDTGNIFINDPFEGSYWNDVQISCEIKCKEEDFDASELKADMHPDYFDPFMIYY